MFQKIDRMLRRRFCHANHIYTYAEPQDYDRPSFVILEDVTETTGQYSRYKYRYIVPLGKNETVQDLINKLRFQNMFFSARIVTLSNFWYGHKGPLLVFRTWRLVGILAGLAGLVALLVWLVI
jgi:hypothetical protein